MHAKKRICIALTTLVLCQALYDAASFLLKGVVFPSPVIIGEAWAEELFLCTPERSPTESSAAPLLMPDLWTMPTASQEAHECNGPEAETLPPPSPLRNLSTAPSGSAPAVQQPGEPGKQGFFDELHGQLSRSLLSTADWLDSFFADPNYVHETNRSYVRFRTDLFQENYARPSFKPAFDVRLSLPQMERKTHLVFSAEPAAAPADKTPAQTVSERFAAPEQQRITTALAYIFRTTPKESFIVSSGLQFSGLEPVVFLTPRYRSLLQYTIWALRFTQELQWKSDTEWQTDTRFDFERPLPRDCFFRTTLDGVWLATTPGYFYSLSFLVRQTLDPTHALQYEMINNFQIAPGDKLTEIAFRVRYRQSYWREWLFFELAPQVRYPNDRNFRMIPGILFRMEMFFGHQS